MSFVKKIIDDYLEGNRGTLSYFDKEGNVHAIRTYADKSHYPSYEDYYLAMGVRINKEVQNKYTRKLRFWAFWEAIQMPAILFSLLIGVVSIILAFITRGEGWPEGIVSSATLFGMGPMFGYMSYNWFFKSWVITSFENAYNKELAKKKSTIALQKVKREKNWVHIVTVVALLALGYFDSWISVAKILIIAFSSMAFGMIEGLLFIGLGQLFSPLFSKKAELKLKQEQQLELSPELMKQVKKWFRVIHQDFHTEKYAIAFDRFGASQKTREEFHQEIQNFLSEQKLTAFHLVSFEETELSVLEITDHQFEVDLFLYDTVAQEFPEFYLICKVNYQGNQLKSIELVEVGY
ncbi:hypothetical protein AB6M97_04680 [Streptococcus hillyeri]|uniref:Uncharacterized protein n=1 Tax=Streptococcus hillyeri TaxID=2282420 RepID=A0A3L9DYD4_9STRE|nr:hypothetical protein [Streptococcus hillyeri]RLY05308.1 hypothetical protein EAF07_01015 [Streptococcus hillyeri]